MPSKFVVSASLRTSGQGRSSAILSKRSLLLFILLLGNLLTGCCETSEHGLWKTTDDLLPVEESLLGSWRLDENADVNRRLFRGSRSDRLAMQQVRVRIGTHPLDAHTYSVVLDQPPQSSSEEHRHDLGSLRIVSLGETRIGDAMQTKGQRHDFLKIGVVQNGRLEMSFCSVSALAKFPEELTVEKRAIYGDVSGIPVPLPRFLISDNVVISSTEDLRKFFEKHAQEESLWSNPCVLIRADPCDSR